MDASGSPSDLSEEFSRQRMHDVDVVLTATNTLIAEIAQDWSTPTGQQLIGLLFDAEEIVKTISETKTPCVR